MGFPKIFWDEHRQWVKDNNPCTTSGAFAVGDMMAHWVLKNYDEIVARLGFAASDL
ncbi:hypothetical protein BJ878DRAFT_321453 [Calycina marina]|uniref:Uncharacterized protein n=1 Tax=Calycina marina TaxID=1763456 RepID=A0A9P7YUK4_9HELO|nr:hypothetical protein BJ878DRAFT_321453 [Calycina marina]